MKSALPNILTYLRLVLTLVVFLGLVALSQPSWFGPDPVQARALSAGLYFLVFGSFIIAAVTDFFDGWLARRWNVVSLTGAILDPIADKVLVAGAIVGLANLAGWAVTLPGGLILFREFSVSALREVLAPKGLKLPVTLLAKWKTTLQLAALTAILFVVGMPFWSLPESMLGSVLYFQAGAVGLLWLATLVTVWTGAEYGFAARKALKGASV
jgi:CDP-diacylglycerol--glycerol-3-phosphate 3-phosphatidyltransferase